MKRSMEMKLIRKLNFQTKITNKFLYKIKHIFFKKI